jgi:hypothetical protein
MPQAYIGRPGRFRSSGRAGGCTSHGRWPRSDPGPWFTGPGRAPSTGAQSLSGRSPVTACRVHTSRKRVIGPSVPAFVLTFDSREKVLDRIVARSVPGRFGLAQVESSDPPAQLSMDLRG